MKTLKIGFVLLSNRATVISSTRISVLNMLPYIKTAGYEPFILFEPVENSERPHLSGVADRAKSLALDIVYFQKVRGDSVVACANELAEAGIKTIYGTCDYIENEMVRATDLTVAVTSYLRSKYDRDLQKKIRVVHDGIENADARVTTYRDTRGSSTDPLGAVLVTASELWRIPAFKRAPPYVAVNVVGSYKKRSSLEAAKQHWRNLHEIQGAREKLAYAQSLSRRRFSRTPWGAETVYREMAEADIGIVPVDMIFDPVGPDQDIMCWELKSENRLTLKMAMGLPVIASPVPSYRDVIVQGENGFIASNRKEWRDCFETLRDPDFRAAIGRHARESVVHKFSKEAQAKRLIAALEEVMAYP